MTEPNADNNPEQPSDEPQPIAGITLALLKGGGEDTDGELVMEGPFHNPYLCLGMLDMARDLVIRTWRQNKRKAQEHGIIQAHGRIPPNFYPGSRDGK